MAMSFGHAESLLGKRTTKKIGNNTYLIRIDADAIAVSLHHTNVVVIRRNGTYVINSGGYQSHTTKERINEYSPASLFQKDFKWFVGKDNVPFKSGMVVRYDGEILSKG